MKFSIPSLASLAVAFVAMLLLVPPTRSAEKPGRPTAPPAIIRDASFRNEVTRAIDRGLEWLKTNQNEAGYWSSSDQPALTGLALLSFRGHPNPPTEPMPPFLKKGYDFILSCARPDGGIHRDKLVTYNTALSMMALLASNEKSHEPVILRARQFLISLQVDFGQKGSADTAYDGGIGYGSKYEHSDMGNTLQALEALYYSKQLAQDQPTAPSRDLDWKAAIHFLQSCQNLPSVNKEPWASDDPQQKGGFIYYPGHSMAGSITNAETGRVALRSYGSISYGGMLSYIYANLKKDDPRVSAVFDWLRRNYTLSENPGMGAQGLFYYFHTMAKALTAYGVDELELPNGNTVSWRKELAMRVINLQQANGSWINEDQGRWWEKDPALVTAYAVLTLELIERGL